MTEHPEEIRRLEDEIADLKLRWPPHSVPVTMWQRLEALEGDLEKAKAANSDGQEDGASQL